MRSRPLNPAVQHFLTVAEDLQVKQREPNNTRRLVSLIASVCLLATMSGSSVLADSHGRPHGGGGGDGGGGDENHIQHVLLLSIDGFHAVDYLNCVKAGTCPALAALGHTGVNYLATSTSKPSDSFPGTNGHHFGRLAANGRRLL